MGSGMMLASATRRLVVPYTFKSLPTTPTKCLQLLHYTESPVTYPQDHGEPWQPFLGRNYHINNRGAWISILTHIMWPRLRKSSTRYRAAQVTDELTYYENLAEETKWWQWTVSKQWRKTMAHRPLTQSNPCLLSVKQVEMFAFQL